MGLNCAGLPIGRFFSSKHDSTTWSKVGWIPSYVNLMWIQNHGYGGNLDTGDLGQSGIINYRQIFYCEGGSGSSPMLFRVVCNRGGLSHLILTTALWSQCCHNPHFIDEELEMQRGSERRGHMHPQFYTTTISAGNVVQNSLIRCEQGHWA